MQSISLPAGFSLTNPSNPKCRELRLPSFIKSIHGIISRSSRLVFYSRNGKVFWKIMPYYNPPASQAQRSCRNAFAEAQRKCASVLKIREYHEYWSQIAIIKKYKSARHAAFAYFYAVAKTQILREISRSSNVSSRKNNRNPSIISSKYHKNIAKQQHFLSKINAPKFSFLPSTIHFTKKSTLFMQHNMQKT